MRREFRATNCLKQELEHQEKKKTETPKKKPQESWLTYHKYRTRHTRSPNKREDERSHRPPSFSLCDGQKRCKIKTKLTAGVQSTLFTHDGQSRANHSKQKRFL
jgi:hypothetical protein